MEELKLIIELIASLPTLAVWVLVAFYAYKVVIVGSIYGVIRYVTQKAFEWAMAKKSEHPKIQEVNFADVLNGITVNQHNTMSYLIAQIRRLQCIRTNVDKNTTIMHNKSGAKYIYHDDVAWLHEAIDEKLKAEKAKE